uniref:PhtB n=1 Tax=Rhodococcus sp. TFB TaxID=326401 RepID=Q2VMX2_9NOCA|nr:PhtB [Rhodococcus sp. TFB]
MTGWLEGKRALIVGAGSGIGRAVVDAYLDEGAQVGVLERDTAKCEKLRIDLPGVVVVEGDATVFADNVSAVTATAEEFGGVDTLVNCVGIFDFYKGIRDIPTDKLVDAFSEMYTTNVLSHLQSVKAALPELEKHAGASIVLAESASSFYPGRGGVLYVSSKFAVRGLVTTLAYELAPRIRVNGVAPGGTLNTDLRGLDSLGSTADRLDDNPDRARQLAARTPLNVALSGIDHAWSFVFFASDRSRGITGGATHPDGGFGIGAPKPNTH